MVASAMLDMAMGLGADAVADMVRGSHGSHGGGGGGAAGEYNSGSGEVCGYRVGRGEGGRHGSSGVGGEETEVG